MSEKVLLIRHMPGARSDRVAGGLAERGFQLDNCYVAEGDRLPHQDNYAAVVVYGGSQMVAQAGEQEYLRDELKWIEGWLRTEKPLLGICLGGQLLAHSLGAPVGPHPEGLSEVGFYPVAPTSAGRPLIPQNLMVYHWHTQGFELPEGAELLATGKQFRNQAFRYGRAYGLQFHPEITEGIQASWMQQAGHMLGNPGAQDRESQLADNPRHLPQLGNWLSGFLDHWLSAEVSPTPAAGQALA